MEEVKKKTVEEKAKEKTIQKLLAFTAAKTFSRHALMDENEYVKTIGYEGQEEESAINKALANLMSDYSVTRMKIKSHLEMIIGIIEMAKGKKAEEIIEGVNKNGRK